MIVIAEQALVLFCVISLVLFVLDSTDCDMLSQHNSKAFSRNIDFTSQIDSNMETDETYWYKEEDT